MQKTSSGQSIPAHKWLFSVLAALFLAVAGPENVMAQFLTADTVSKPDPEWTPDSLGRRTPRGTVQGFIKAVAEENYQRAAQYLHLTRAQKRRKNNAAKLAMALQTVLDKKGTILPYNLISKDPQGYIQDNLGITLDKVGEATINGESFSIILEKTEDADGAPLWLFSSQTVQRLAAQADNDETMTSTVDSVTPNFLEDYKWSGVPVGHWLAMLILAIAAYLLAWAVSKLVLWLIRFSWRKAQTEPTAGILKAFALPIRIYLAVWLFVAASEQVGISIIVRQKFSMVTFVVGVAAMLLLLWRLFNTSTMFVERRLTSRNNMAGVSAVLFLRRLAKVAVIVIGILLILDSFGFDVTTGIAALGIGGLALALGAQKTVENFVGSVTLLADQPVRVGDYCKVGETVGTVEQIGMRSTRIRTLSRTVVTIPNGEFSSQRIENYAHRDQFKLQIPLRLRPETSPDQLRFLLVQMRTVLYAHPKVDPDPARVRLMAIGTESLDLEIFAYLTARDYNDFLEIQEDILLRMMDLVGASGTGFATPSRTLYLARDKGVSNKKMQEAEAQVQQWREAGELQIPSFDPEKIENLKNTIKYPPEGAAVQIPDQPTLF